MLGIILVERRRPAETRNFPESIVQTHDPGQPHERPPAAVPERAPRIDSVVFARRNEVLRGCLALSSMPRLLSAGVGGEGLLEWEIEGSVGRDELQRQREFLRVRTAFSPWMTCSRCLSPVQVATLKTDTRFRMAASEAQAAAEDRDEEEVEVMAANPHLDVAALVEDEAILALPMAPVHDSCEWTATVGPDPISGL